MDAKKYYKKKELEVGEEVVSGSGMIAPQPVQIPLEVQVDSLAE